MTSPPSSVPGATMCLTCSSSKNWRMVGSISSFSPLRESAPGLVMMAPQRVMTAGSSTKHESGYSSSAGSSVTSTPHCFRAAM